MADLHKELLEEQFGDAALQLLMDEYAEADGEKLLSLYEENAVQIPPDLDAVCQAQIQTLYKKTEKGALLRRTVYRAGKIAAAILIIFSLSANLILSVEAIRVPFLNFCFETQRYFSNLSFLADGETKKDSKDDQTVSLPISAPKGYQIVTKQHNHDGFDKIYADSVLFLGYQNEDGDTLLLQTYPAAGTLSIDTEDADHVQFDLNGMQAIQIHEEKDGMFRTIWIDAERQRVYDVTCNGLSEEAFQQYVFGLSGMFMSPALYAQ